ncbi:MAG: hypothetical protein VZS44_08185 [Bacilli bacterium]|nr:hypothetical protein [Bacilli bacterium]
MNEVILDGKVQKNINFLSDIISFNISSITGKFKLIDNSVKNRFTYIRVIYPYQLDEYTQSILVPDNMVRIYGKIDSEQYETKDGKIVYNKIICANKIVKIYYNDSTKMYEEVI